MSDLTISEVKAKIREAEKEICLLLENLQNATGVAVDDVRVYTTPLEPIDGRPDRLITHVRIATGSL